MLQVYSFSVQCPQDIFSDVQAQSVIESFIADYGYGTGIEPNANGGGNIIVYCHMLPTQAEIATIMGTLRQVWGDVFTYAGTHLSQGDWLAKSQQLQKSIAVGKFYIYQSKAPADSTDINSTETHSEVINSTDIKNGLEKPKTAKIPLAISAGHAFGVGNHGTTQGCLLALSVLHKYYKNPQNIADIGTGTGILTIAVAKLYPMAQLHASDIDAIAVKSAVASFEHNGVLKRVTTVQSAGFKNSLYRNGTQYDIVIANILAQPLKKMAYDIYKRTHSGSVVILSGMMPHHKYAVLQRYKNLGFKVVKTYIVDGWVTVVIGR